MKNLGQKSEGLLVVVACHGVYDAVIKQFYAEHPEDVPVYEKQLRYAFQHIGLREKDAPLLIFSGGPTKAATTRAEGASYIDWARALNIPVPGNVAYEDFALTSTENLLFSVYRYHQIRTACPKAIHVISWAFKENRFVATLEAINQSNIIGTLLPAIEFFAVGNLTGASLREVETVETAYVESLKAGIRAIYQNPATSKAVGRRDVHSSRSTVAGFYRDYPMPF
jgi:hypothetical protein